MTGVLDRSPKRKLWFGCDCLLYRKISPVADIWAPYW